VPQFEVDIERDRFKEEIRGTERDLGNKISKLRVFRQFAVSLHIS